MRTFINNNNQLAFTKYEEIKRSDGMSSPSINQYRSTCYTLEEVLNGQSFENLTVAQVNKAREIKPTKVNHLNGFIIDTYNSNIVSYNSDVVIACLDERTRKAITKLMSN